MRDFTKNLQIAHNFPILELVRELTIGQRSTNTVELLSAFLHENIFPKLGPFRTEIYVRDQLSGDFLIFQTRNQVEEKQESIPECISKNLPIIKELAATQLPHEILFRSKSIPEFPENKNSTQLLVPIQDDSELLGLLYLSSISPCSFSPDFLGSMQTLAAVIGSRLKSMGTIQQLERSMNKLEYADRLRTALYEISEQAHCSENFTDLYAKLHQKVSDLLHARNFFIALTEKRKDGTYIKFPYYVDQNDTRLQGMELPLDQDRCSITGYVIKTRRPLLLTPTNFAEICREQNIDCVGTRPHSWLGAPFFIGKIAGAVAIKSYNNIVYTEKDKELLSFVARHIGEALHRKQSVDELRVAKEQAERAERNKSNFLANMSHEIRTPMNGIIGLTDLVLHSDISGQKRTYLEMIHSSADRLLKLINDILDFSKIEAGKLELDIAPFSLRFTVAQSLEILSISAAKKNIDLTVHCQDDIPDLLLGDAGKLSQILINLVGNGIKFTDNGGVELTVTLNDRDHHQDDPVNLHFQIRDTGIGIEKADIGTIFTAFRQLGTSKVSNQRGTGLGLVIANELVEMMGGKICVDSTPGVGTTFYFTLQFSPVPEELSATGMTAEDDFVHSLKKKPESNKPLQILLVEDEYISRTLACTILEHEGWQVSAAENGKVAMDMLKNDSFDLILMDIQMPELNGYQTTRAIRRQENASKTHIPIIAMTAYAVKGDREKCLAAGMDGYIAKPIRPDRLRLKIESILQHQDKPHTP